MALKPNYNQQRVERNRAKQEKRERKEREFQERKAAKLEHDHKDATTNAVETDDSISGHSE